MRTVPRKRHRTPKLLQPWQKKIIVEIKLNVEKPGKKILVLVIMIETSLQTSNLRMTLERVIRLFQLIDVGNDLRVVNHQKLPFRVREGYIQGFGFGLRLDIRQYQDFEMRGRICFFNCHPR